LIIDADAVLPFAVPLQGFEPIPGRGGQIEQNVRRVQLVQFAPGHRLDIHKTVLFDGADAVPEYLCT